MINPTLDIHGKQSHYIRDIIKETRRWESIPNRKEPITKEMVEYIIHKGNENKKNPDNIYSALGNWLVLGLQTGFRRKEWAQDRTYLKKHNDIQRNVDGSSAAFILSDFEFRLKGNKHMTLNSPSNIKRASIVNIKWCFQKNNDNGQVISYVIDHKNKTYCAIEASKKIYNRAIKHNIPSNKPIAIFIEVKNNKKKTCFIDDVHIKTILQEAAQSIYHITKKEDISKFTAHSIRV